MDISVHQNKFVNKLFDKRNDFNFNVISLPNLASNIPINQAYGTFYSQIVRIFNANNNFMNFVNDIKYLILKLTKQNFNKRLLFIYVKLFLKKFEFHIITKFLTKISMNLFTH